MKAKILAASLLALSSTAFASDVAMSVSVGQPGFYGRIDIGGYPQPQVVYAQPVLVQRPVRYVESAPIYLRVPPGHRKHWSRHCGYYNACGQRVLFVQDGWYTNNYAPHYRANHGHGGRGPEHHGRPDDRRDHHRDDHRGPGPDRGHGDHRGDRGDNHGDHRGPGRRD
ncbi:hypothetical protein [Duganella aceris]|uniref:DUF3300 domain-containing protein n=1 Tax=Duganella aceris TaxID=2703883 RepID=A0ABX0FGE2_9BURK|nr:hypothetical protein [Duganella aceris]NGZ83637.1 hypothetical protein [Duganella aceris]